MIVALIFMIIVAALEFIALVVGGFFLYKFVKVIMIIEDDLTDVAVSLTDVEDAMKAVEELKMFYEDDSIRHLVTDILDRVKIARFYVNLMAKKFTDRSKNRYVVVEPTEDEIIEQLALNQPPPQQQHAQ